MNTPGTHAPRRAVVLLSGGLDSATVLAMARAEGLECFALSVHYGQRHEAELAAAARVARGLGAAEHRVMGVDLAVNCVDGGVPGNAADVFALPAANGPQIHAGGAGMQPTANPRKRQRLLGPPQQH